MEIAPHGASSIGVHVYGVDSDYRVAVGSEEGTVATGIQLETSATRNSFKVIKNDGTTNVTDNSTNKDNEGVYGNSYPRAAVDRNNSNQTAIATATQTKVAFNHAQFDHGAAFDVTTNYRWTPGRLGVARVLAQVAWLTMADSVSMYISIYKNGVQYREVQTASGGAQADQGPMISSVIDVTAATDYFEIWVRQDSGGNRDIDGGNGRTWASFLLVV